MRAPRRAALLLALTGLACGRDKPAPAPAPGPSAPTPAAAGDDAETLLRRDARVAGLLYPCSRNTHFDRDTSDVAAILIEKLQVGQTEPLNRAKEELAAMGPLAIAELGRLFDRSYGDAMAAAGPLQNALDTIGRTDPATTPGAHDLLMQAALHPRDTVAFLALGGLSNGHARPGDYEILRQRVDFGTPQLRQAFAGALFDADPARAAGEYLDWVSDRTYGDVWPIVLPRLLEAATGEALAEEDRAAVARRAAQLWEDALPEARYFLAAVASRAGDGGALAWLLEELEAGQPERSARAVQVLVGLKHADSLVEVLGGPFDPALRVLAAHALSEADGAADEGSAVRRALQTGMEDEALDVRRACTILLVGLGDADATDRSLLGLAGPLQELELSLQALLTRLDEDPELAGRALARLKARHDSESHLLWKQRLATLQAIGQVPDEEAASFLYELGLEYAEEPIESLRGHRWLTMQVANTGPAGRRLLFERLAAEDDPLRRLDLLWGAASERSEDVRKSLLELVEGDTLHPYELLFAADRLCRVGPASEVAPRLKRVCLRVEHPEVRPALQCLLWKWY